MNVAILPAPVADAIALKLFARRPASLGLQADPRGPSGRRIRQAVERMQGPHWRSVWVADGAPAGAVVLPVVDGVDFRASVDAAARRAADIVVTAYPRSEHAPNPAGAGRIRVAASRGSGPVTWEVIDIAAWRFVDGAEAEREAFVRRLETDSVTSLLWTLRGLLQRFGGAHELFIPLADACVRRGDRVGLKLVVQELLGRPEAPAHVLRRCARAPLHRAA